jgi:hypothetical protein
MSRGVGLTMRLLAKVEDSNAHYLIEYGILQHPTHILSSENALVLLMVLPAKQKQNAGISFHHHP